MRTGPASRVVTTLPLVSWRSHTATPVDSAAVVAAERVQANWPEAAFVIEQENVASEEAASAVART